MGAPPSVTGCPPPSVLPASAMPLFAGPFHHRSLVLSAMTGVLVAETEADLRARVADLLAALGQTGHGAEAWLAERRGRWIMGTPEQALERVSALEANGTQRIMLQDFVPRDLDHVRLMGKIFTA